MRTDSFGDPPPGVLLKCRLQAALRVMRRLHVLLALLALALQLLQRLLLLRCRLHGHVLLLVVGRHGLLHLHLHLHLVLHLFDLLLLLLLERES